MAKFGKEKKKTKVLGFFSGFPLSMLSTLKYLSKHPRELVDIQTPSLTRGSEHAGQTWSPEAQGFSLEL